MTVERSCGPCTECCRVIGVSDPQSTLEGFSKPTDTRCEHCTSSGCGIYATRYTVCRTFKCAWLTDTTGRMLFDVDRPDVSGLIITIPGPPTPERMLGRQVLIAHECFPDASVSPAGIRLLDRLVANGAIVFGALRGHRGRLVSAPSQPLAERAWSEMLSIALGYTKSQPENL